MWKTKPRGVDEAREPRSPATHALMLKVGELHGLGADDAAGFARDGVLDFDDIVVAVVAVVDAVANDICIVSPLIGLSAGTPADVLRVLRANFMLASTTGFSIGSTSDGGLHLIHTMRAADLDAEGLAGMLSQCATLARAVQEEFASAAADLVTGVFDPMRMAPDDGNRMSS